MHNYIYLDHGATTPLHPQALEAMLPWLQDSYANPSSLYGPAREAREAIERSRATVAAILGCRATEIVFTSGGTESVNAALRGIGLAQLRSHSGNEIITTTIEHHAVLHTCQELERFGIAVHQAGVDRDARVLPGAIESAISAKTAMVSVMLANNEVGTIEPVAEIAQSVRKRGAEIGKQILIHTDAIAAAGQVALDLNELGVDALSLAAHKFGGPKGAGILYLRRGVPFTAQLTGGGQEHQRRAGTEDVAAIAGTARALEIATSSMRENLPHLTRLRDRLIQGILAAIPGAELNGHPVERLAGNASFRIADINGEELLQELDAAGIAASSGSACADASWEPSHVVLAMGCSMAEAAGSLRFTLGSETTETEIDSVVARLPAIIARLRGHAPALPLTT